MIEKQNNKNKKYNKVIDAMNTIRNYCNDAICAECPFYNPVSDCYFKNYIMDVPMTWVIPQKW